jgi:hypothetical protein
MNDKKINQDERKDKLSEREELEALMKQNADSLVVLTEEAKKLAPKTKPLVFDYINISKISLQESKDIVESNAKFYLQEEAIKTEEYIQQKIRADVATMHDLLKQSKIAEYAIIRMIEQIDEGNMHPRQFEVLAGFQRSKLELTKTVAQYVIMMENNYKNMKEDYKNKRNESALDIDSEEVITNEGTGDMITKGTRTMLQNMRKTIEEVKDENDKIELQNKINKENDESDLDNK